MKSLTATFTFFFLINQSFSQIRFFDPIFPEIKVTENVMYGENSTLLFLGQTGHVKKISLLTDIYEPVGDTESQRPLVLVFHEGYFLPPIINGRIAGHKRDSSVVEICKQFARRGYVAAACSYRVGWNPIAVTQPERMLGLIQAIYRGVQDGRTAIRFFKKSYFDGINPYGIDPERIVVCGIGDSGGYIVNAMAGLDDYGKILQTTNPAAKFILDLDNDGVPETPAVVPQYHGDIEGKELTIVPTSDFGIPEGDTTNFPNHPDYSSDFQLAINIGGAVADISWIDENSVPIISIQSYQDQFVPYGDAVLLPPGAPPAWIVQVQGSKIIAEKQDRIGKNEAWKQFIHLDRITDQASGNSNRAGHDYFEGLFPWVKPRNSFGSDEGVVLNWWNPSDTVSLPQYPDYQFNFHGMALDSIINPWNSSLSYHDIEISYYNQGMSPDKAKSNLDTILQYVLPRACVTLGMRCQPTDVINVQELSRPVKLKIVPNPGIDFVEIQSQNYLFYGLQVFDLQGRLVRNYSDLKTRFYKIEKGDLDAGIYFLKIEFEEGTTVRKLVFK